MQADKFSLPMQREDLIAYSKLVLGIDDYEVFEDAGYSGKNTARPAFQKMIARIRNREFTHLLVWKIDRISRNLLDFATLYEELQELRVTFVSKNEQFDTSTAMGGAMLKIVLVFAELERNMTAERVSATMLSRASQGYWNGGRITYGYSYDKESKTFAVNEDEAKAVRLIYDDYLEYKSTIHTTTVLNESGFLKRDGEPWNVYSVWLILSNPFYIGEYIYNRFKGTSKKIENPKEEWIKIENHHEAIISPETQAKVAAILSENDRMKNVPGRSHGSSKTHIFGDVCYCGVCGLKMGVGKTRPNKNGMTRSLYQCPSHRKRTGCVNKGTSDIPLGDFVFNYALNVLNVQREFDESWSIERIEKGLLKGLVFSEVFGVDKDDLNDFRNMLTDYGPEDVEAFTYVPSQDEIDYESRISAISAELDKQRRALLRLQDLFLYSDTAMSEKDFVLRKSEITLRIEELEDELVAAQTEGEVLPDQAFIEAASHVILTTILNGSSSIYFKDLYESIDHEEMKRFINTIISRIDIVDSKVSCITFKNGKRHRFIRE